MIKLVVLGVSGSIGKQVLQIVRENPKEFEIIGNAIADVVDAMNTSELDKVINEVKERINELTSAHPIY